MVWHETLQEAFPIRFQRILAGIRSYKKIKWCPEEDSNLHSLRNTDLNRARLPIPPSGQRASCMRAGRRCQRAKLERLQSEPFGGVERRVSMSTDDGRSAAADCKDGATGEEIVKLELGTGVPIIYKLNADSTVASKEVLT